MRPGLVTNLLTDMLATPTLLQFTLKQAYLCHHLCINMPALTIQPRHCLCMRQSPPSHQQMYCRCVAGGHCQGGWAADASDCSKDLLELPVALAAGHQGLSSCRLSHTLLSATESASGGLLELLPAFCYHTHYVQHIPVLWQSWVIEPTHVDLLVSKHQANAARSGPQCKWQKMEGPQALGRVRP